MQKSARATQARREVTRRLKESSYDPLKARPRGGWIRAIRSALGMSQSALAMRLDVTPANISKLEQRETSETITLAKLAEAAQAMDCQLVYFFAPNRPLDDIVQSRARDVAAQELGYVETTMGLELQAVGLDRRRDLIEQHAQEILAANRQWSTG